MKRIYLLLAAMTTIGLTACTTQIMRKKLDGPVVVLQESVRIPQYKEIRPAMAMHIAWHPNGKEFAVVDNRGYLVIFNANSRRFARKLPRSSYPEGFWESPLAYSPDGQYVAMGGVGNVNIFDTHTGDEIRNIIDPQVSGKGSKTTGLIFSPDSQFLAVTYKGWHAADQLVKDTVAVYPVKAGQAIFTYQPPRHHSTSHISANVLYSKDGKQLYVSRASLLPFEERKKTNAPFRYFNFIDYLDSQTGEVTEAITPVHIMDPTALALSPDGRYIASGTSTGSSQSAYPAYLNKPGAIRNEDPVRLWDIKTHYVVREYAVQKRARALAVSPDSRYLAVHHNLQIVIFDFASGLCLQTIEFEGNPGFSSSRGLVFSPDSKVLAVPLDSDVHLLHITQ